MFHDTPPIPLQLYGSMTALALSMVILIAVNVDIPALAEGVKNDRKCLSTLEDFKEAYFRGDCYHSDLGEWKYDAYFKGTWYKQMGLTMGFYCLTYDSQEAENSTHIKWGECCYPSKDDNHCLAIIAFHSPVYNIFHPLLLRFLAIPFNPRILLFGADHIRLNMRASSGVHCWNVPPVCSNRSNAACTTISNRFQSASELHTCSTQEEIYMSHVMNNGIMHVIFEIFHINFYFLPICQFVNLFSAVTSGCFLPVVYLTLHMPIHLTTWYSYRPTMYISTDYRSACMKTLSG